MLPKLKLLEHHQLLVRQAFATAPPTVGYTLTEKGAKLEPVLDALNDWSKECLPRST
ncbi:winged helix-turn-helix transcriptional regulator [Pedobacter hiemivivus]|uniref:Winged helix-turn-helix transcriptional regulator n=1 Tax=Pedobacter hiemivivus TaxID=2530454 RepID=A0A4U1GIP8_9SPHI|nr:winged helix-turn-helix transcriptional regulator [Pedobacter hiemivivus]